MDKTQLRSVIKPRIIYTLSTMSRGRLDSQNTNLFDNQASVSLVLQKQDIEMQIYSFIHDDLK